MGVWFSEISAANLPAKGERGRAVLFYCGAEREPVDLIAGMLVRAHSRHRQDIHIPLLFCPTPAALQPAVPQCDSSSFRLRPRWTLSLTSAPLVLAEIDGAGGRQV